MLTVQFIVLQIIVFFAVLFFLKKIISGDTENTVQRLGVVYEDLLKKQKELTEKIEEAEKEYQAKKEESATIADKLAAQALDEAHKKEDEILKKARAEAEDIISKAHGSKEQFLQEMEIAASKKEIDFVAMLLEHAYDEDLRRMIHTQFVKKFVEQAKSSDLSSVDLRGQKPILKTAYALTEDEKNILQKVLSEGLKMPALEIEETIDAKLIAGIALQIGTLVVDGSFANTITEAAKSTKEKLSNS